MELVSILNKIYERFEVKMPTITEIGHRQFKLFINNNNF